MSKGGKAEIFNSLGVVKTDRVAVYRFAKTWERMLDAMADGQEVDLNTMEGMLRVMGLEATVASDSPEEIQARIVESILHTESLDDALTTAVGELASGRELAENNTKLRLFGVRWNQTDYEEGLPFYGVVEAMALETGEKFNFACGAVTAVAQLFRINREQAWPIDVTLRTSGRTTKKGFTPYFFVKIPAENKTKTGKK